MGMEHYLKELLYRYNCVVIPGFGAFLTQKRSAIIHQATNTLYPPTKTLAFNAQLTTNDGLLVSHMAEMEHTDYETMLVRLADQVSNWKKVLGNGERLVIDAVGELWQNSEERIQFQPLENENFLTTSFGFTPFVATPISREVLKEEVDALEEKVPFTITPEKHGQHGLRPYFKYAAIFLLGVALTATMYRSYRQVQENQQMVRQQATEQVSRQIQEATFFDTTPMELPTLTLEVSKKERAFNTNKKIHHVIAGAFRLKKNADRKLRKLKQLGFSPSYIGTNPFGLHMVTYDSYTDPQKALAALRKIKRTQSPDAWLKSVE